MSAKFACPVSGFTLPEIEPRLFSFNNPYGACPACDGLGRKMLMDPELIVPDPDKSVAKGAVEPWSSTTMNWYPQTLISICKHYGASPDTPWRKLPAKVREVILYGSGAEQVRIELEDGLRKFETKKPFEGVVNNLQRRWRETEVGLDARGAVALHELDHLRGLRRLPAQARGAVRQDRRPAHRRGHRAVDPRRRSPGSPACRRSSRPSSRRSPPACSRRSASGWASSTRSGSPT